MDTSEQFPLMSGARYVAKQITAPQRIEWAIKEIEANLQERPGIVFDYAKSLIETTCKTIFKENGRTADEGWSVQQLASFTLKAVVRVPPGHPDPASATARLETALKGLVGVVQGLGELRNLEGELGHGQEAERITLGSSHAEFAARAADTVVKFLVEAHRGSREAEGEALTLSYYENPDFNDYIDELHKPVAIFSGEYKASDILFRMDLQSYKDALGEFSDEPEEAEE